MRVGIHTNYWSAGPPAGMQEIVHEADRLGLDSIWTAEAYGSDAFTPLAWWGSTTQTVRLGTAIAQMSARTPTATAMQALTLDHLSGGRFLLGLGASGPQVVEGWYGQPYRRPLARTREYVDVVRQVFRRGAPVALDGDFFQLPLSAERGGTGLGKPLRPTVHPLRPDLPILLAAEGPKNIALAAEICDGWLPAFYAPRLDAMFRGFLAEGFAARSPELGSVDRFEVAASVPVSIDDDVEKAADRLRPWLALYVGGMGAKGANFHRNAVELLGYSDACDEIQDHYLAGRKDEAARAVPTALVEDVALVGPGEKIAAELGRWETSAVTTMLLQADAASVRTVVGAAASAGLLER
jgi:F420-dependent oxidoreductase-like protein